jgi:hypothetical protein
MNVPLVFTVKLPVIGQVFARKATKEWESVQVQSVPTHWAPTPPVSVAKLREGDEAPTVRAPVGEPYREDAHLVRIHCLSSFPYHIAVHTSSL